MPLPKIEHPLFELEVPSTGKKVKYRPFTVKEEKILLIAQESKDIDQTLISIKQIINNCVFDLDVETISLFDLEYIIINLRSKSVNNEVEFTIKDPETGENVHLTLDLDGVSVISNENHTNKIKIDENTVITMKYPSVNELMVLLKNPDDKTAIFDIMFRCMDKLVFGDEVYKFSEYTNEEIEDFVNSLSSDTLKKMETFFETMPRVRHEMPYTRKDGTQKTFVLEGLDNFFI